MSYNKKIFFYEKKCFYNDFNMLVISGASASGKTEVARVITRKYGLKKVITVTTRDKRVGEQDGIDYFFVTKEQFEKMIKNDELVEYISYNNNYYGSKKDQITDDRILVIDAEGLKSYISLNISSIITFALISDYETREKRMIARGDKLEDIKKRLESDTIRFSKENLQGVDFFIENENKTLEELADDIYLKYQQKLKSVK